MGKGIQGGTRARLQQEEDSDLLLEVKLIEDAGLMNFRPWWAEAAMFKEDRNLGVLHTPAALEDCTNLF